jgi:hypothetical protein
MDRQRALIIGMTAAIAALAVALAFMLGRQSVAPTTQPAPTNKVAAASAHPAPGNMVVEILNPQHPDSQMAMWLAGGWAEESTNCQTDTGDYYDGNGRYGTSGREGRWRIENGQLIVTVTHEAVGDPMAHEFIGLPNPEIIRSPITREGQDRMVQIVDGRPVRMMRCPAAHHSFAT